MKRAKYKPTYSGRTMWAHAYNDMEGMVHEHPYLSSRYIFIPERPMGGHRASNQGLLQEVLLVEFSELEFETAEESVHQ